MAASGGWIHFAAFYIKDKEAMEITFVNPLKINTKYYDIIKGNLDTGSIDKFLKSVAHEYLTS